MSLCFAWNYDCVSYVSIIGRTDCGLTVFYEFRRGHQKTVTFSFVYCIQDISCMDEVYVYAWSVWSQFWINKDDIEKYWKANLKSWAL